MYSLIDESSKGCYNRGKKPWNVERKGIAEVKRKISLIVGTAALCAALLTGCGSPVDNVIELVENGNLGQAQQIYAEKISGKEEYENSFAEKFIPYLENLIEGYNNGELSEEKINEDFEAYKRMVGENAKFSDAEKELSQLEISKHCFDTAEKLRLEGELTQAYLFSSSLAFFGKRDIITGI